MTEEQKQREEKIKKDLDGFQSLVSAEEHEAVAKLKDAVENLIAVHNRNVDNLKCLNPTSQQAIHYATFGDIIIDVLQDVQCLETIDTEGAKALAEVRVDNDTTYEKMVKAKFMDKMFSDIFGR